MGQALPLTLCQHGRDEGITNIEERSAQNSNSHPKGWPSMTHGSADVPAYLRVTTVLTGLPAGAAELPTRSTRLGLIYG